MIANETYQVALDRTSGGRRLLQAIQIPLGRTVHITAEIFADVYEEGDPAPRRGSYWRLEATARHEATDTGSQVVIVGGTRVDAATVILEEDGPNPVGPEVATITGGVNVLFYDGFAPGTGIDAEVRVRYPIR